MRKLILSEPDLQSTFPKELAKGLGRSLVIETSRHAPDGHSQNSFRLKHICFIIWKVQPVLERDPHRPSTRLRQ